MLRVFVFDELFAADQSLRGQARRVREAAGDLAVPTGGLPPEAQSVVTAVAALRGRLERAADSLVEAAAAFGQTGAAAQRVDTPSLLDAFGTAMKGNLLPPGDYGPLGPYPWILGRLAFLTDSAVTALRHRYGYPWAKDNKHWRTNGSGPRLHPRTRDWVDRGGKVLKVGGPAITALTSFSRRAGDGDSLPRATAGGVAESATVFGCATAGARAGGAVPIPHPLAKGALVVGGGVVGGAACSGPGKWVGDKVSDGVREVGDFVKDKLLPKPPKIGWP